MENKIVVPKDFQCWNMSIMQLFGKGPKATVVCGNCSETFQKRIFMVNSPTLRCPNCQTLNELPLTIGTLADKD